MEIETAELPLGQLNLYYNNPRIGNVKMIEESLQKTGQYRAIVVNKGTHTERPMEILAGNHTVKAARGLGWQTILAHIVDVDEETATRIVLADNRTSDLAKTDYDTVLELTAGLSSFDGTGFTQDSLNELLGILEEEDEDGAEELEDTTDEDLEVETVLIVIAHAKDAEEQKAIYKVLMAAGYDQAEMREIEL